MCIYVCTYIRINIFMFIYVYICTYTCTHARTHACTHARTLARTHTHTQTHTHTHTQAFDFRGRVEGLSDKNAGNYNGGCLYDKATYSSPAAIRSSLQGKPPYSRCDPLPGPGFRV